MEFKVVELINALIRYLDSKGEMYRPLRGSWQESVYFRNEWIELYWETPLSENSDKWTSNMLAIPLTKQAEKIFHGKGLVRYNKGQLFEGGRI